MNEGQTHQHTHSDVRTCTHIPLRQWSLEAKILDRSEGTARSIFMVKVYCFLGLTSIGEKASFLYLHPLHLPLASPPAPASRTQSVSASGEVADNEARE